MAILGEEKLNMACISGDSCDSIFFNFLKANYRYE